MTRYKNLNLFSSGPHRITDRGPEQRHLAHAPPGADGAVITTTGHEPRRFDQTGTLLADDPADLQAQLDAIEAAMDGRSGPLVDDLGRTHEHTLMTRFEPGPIHRRGGRFAVDYTATYLRSEG